MVLSAGDILHTLELGKQAASGLYARPAAGETKKELSDPRREAYDDIIKDMEKGNFGGFVERPTGTGKTILFGDVLPALQLLLAQRTQESGQLQGEGGTPKPPIGWCRCGAGGWSRKTPALSQARSPCVLLKSQEMQEHRHLALTMRCPSPMAQDHSLLKL